MLVLGEFCCVAAYGDDGTLRESEQARPVRSERSLETRRQLVGCASPTTPQRRQAAGAHPLPLAPPRRRRLRHRGLPKLFGLHARSPRRFGVFPMDRCPPAPPPSLFVATPRTTSLNPNPLNVTSKSLDLNSKPVSKCLSKPLRLLTLMSLALFFVFSAPLVPRSFSTPWQRIPRPLTRV
jgi:hypothetical protein